MQFWCRIKKGSFSSAKKKGKKKVTKLDAKPKQQQQKLKVGRGKPKGKCFTCGQKGHYKNNCPQKKSHNGNNSGMPHAYIVEMYLIACTTGT